MEDKNANPRPLDISDQYVLLNHGEQVAYCSYFIIFQDGIIETAMTLGAGFVAGTGLAAMDGVENATEGLVSFF